jgi:hypothetical protein
MVGWLDGWMVGWLVSTIVTWSSHHLPFSLALLRSSSLTFVVKHKMAKMA